MGEQIAIHLRDLGKPLVDAWNREFAGISSVRVSAGDIRDPFVQPLTTKSNYLLERNRRKGAPMSSSDDAVPLARKPSQP
jgi:hypothetical protein